MENEPEFSESRILPLALRVARRMGEPKPSLVQHATGTREQVNLVMTRGGNWVPGNERCYLIAIRGNFSSEKPVPPSMRTTPPERANWSVQMLVVDSGTGRVTDSGGSNQYPDLESLGPVVTDYPSDEPSAVDGVEVRPVRPDDAPMVARLLERLGYPSSIEDVERRLGALDDADSVLVTDGGLIALHRITRLAEGTPLARITALVVSPGYRDQGVARALLAAARKVARGWGCEEMEVSCGLREERAAAHHFYLAHGFRDIHRTSTYYRRAVELERSEGPLGARPDA